MKNSLSTQNRSPGWKIPLVDGSRKMAETSSHNMVVVITTAPHGENNQHKEHGGREKRETDTGLTVTRLLGKFQQSAYSISIDGDMVLDEKTTFNQDFDALAPDVFLWTKENDLQMTCQMSSANLKKTK